MNITAQEKQVFVVLGMARTGTSVVSRSLKALGVCHGPSLIGAGDKLNPKGFWEDKEVVFGIHRKIFSLLNREPYEAGRIPAEAQAPDQLEPATTAAIKLMNDRFVTTTRYGFKDTATVRLLAFWQEIFKVTYVDDHYVIVLRHPLACARSYQKLAHCEMEVGLLLWCSYLLQAIDGTVGRKRVVVDYNLMLKNPRKQLHRIAETFHIDEINEAEAASFTQDFLEAKLDRYGANDEEFETILSSKAVPLCRDIYQLLFQVADDSLDINSDAFKTAWQNIMDDYQKVYPVHCYLDQLLQRRKNLRTRVRQIHKSLVWKFLAPLRWVDDALRRRRRKKHLLNRAVTPHA